MQMRMHGERRHVAHPGEGDLGGGELRGQRFDIVGAEHRGDPPVGLGAALDPLDIGGEVGIGGQRRVRQHVLRQHPPFAVALDRDQDVDAVAGLEHAVGRDGGVGEADALGRAAALVLEQRHRHPVGHGIEHGDRDVGALPAARPRQQGFEDRLIGVHPGGDVDHGDADPRRRFRPAGDGGEARFGLDQEVIGLALRIGAALAIARHRAGDEPRDSRGAGGRGRSRAAPPRRA